MFTLSEGDCESEVASRCFLRKSYLIFILSSGGGKGKATRLPLTTTAWVQLQAACGMSFTLHSQCLVVFPFGFSSTLRRAQNCSNWNCLIRPTGLARICSG